VQNISDVSTQTVQFALSSSTHQTTPPRHNLHVLQLLNCLTNSVPNSNISNSYYQVQYCCFDLGVCLTLSSEKLIVKFGTEAKRLCCQISWKSDFHFSRNRNERHEPTNQQTRPITIPPGGRGSIKTQETL